MSDDERQALLAKMQASIEEAKRLTQEQARHRLAAEGFCDEKGELSPSYGGETKE